MVSLFFHLQDKGKENFCGFQMLNTLQRADGSRGKWATDKSKKRLEHVAVLLY